MSSLIKAVFDKECAHVVADGKLVKALANYVSHLTHKNQDHINFFGGNLVGVDVVRFMPNDRDAWFDEIIEADEFIIDDALRADAKEVEAIKEQWEVSSDVMNLSCLWLLNLIRHSPKLKDGDKYQAMMAVLFILQFKFFTSRLVRHWKYPADRATAEAAYASLTYKFSIKKDGNWLKFFNRRSNDVIVYYTKTRDVIGKMDNDKQIVDMVNDIQGRIREMLKNLYDVYLTVRNQGIKITTHSMTVEHDGDSFLKDKINGMALHVNYLLSVVGDQNSFIKEELTSVVEKIMPTMPPKHFHTTLVWLSANANNSYSGKIRTLLEDTLTHSFEYLSDNRAIMRNTSDLPGLLSRLRGVYMSSRSSDPALLSIRETCEHIVTVATDNKSSSMISSVRTGTLLYITLRAMTKNHYSRM